MIGTAVINTHTAEHVVKLGLKDSTLKCLSSRSSSLRRSLGGLGPVDETGTLM
jgi:hypothetical protein